MVRVDKDGIYYIESGSAGTYHELVASVSGSAIAHVKAG